MIIPTFVADILNKLEDKGFEAYVVGGCVRDSLLGKVPYDWDITTSAAPNEVVEALCDFKTIPTGICHGTITVISEGTPVEVTTYRIDGDYKDNRHPTDVRFTSNLTEDLSRRDFTINALAYNPKTGLVDIFGGQEDLNNKTIRCVGTPSLRFKEDALRILRCLRFAAVLNFDIDSKTKSAATKYAALLENISRERIFSEFSKVLMAADPSLVLTEFSEVFANVLRLQHSFFKPQWDKNSAAIKSLPVSLPLRFALLLYGLSAEDIQNCLSELKCSKAFRLSTQLLANQLTEGFVFDRISIKHKLRQIGAENLQLVLAGKFALGLISAEDFFFASDTLNQILAANTCLCVHQLAVDGDDLKDAFMLKGKAIGSLLRLLLDAVIEERCQNDKASLLEYAKLCIHELRP